MLEQQRMTLLALAAVGIATAGVLVTFWVALEPVQVDRCNTTLADSAFKSALIPVHLAAAAVVSVCLLALGGGRRTRLALAAVWVYALACLVEPGWFGPAAMAGMLAAPTIGLVGLLVLLVRALLVLRSARPVAEQWTEHAGATRVLLWGALLIGIPAHLAYAWLSGADIFCF